MKERKTAIRDISLPPPGSYCLTRDDARKLAWMLQLNWKPDTAAGKNDIGVRIRSAADGIEIRFSETCYLLELVET